MRSCLGGTGIEYGVQLILESWGRWLGKNWKIALVLTHEEQGGGHTEHMDKGEEGLEVE